MAQPYPRRHGYLYQYCNCRIMRGGEIFREDFWVRDGKIMDPEVLFYVEKVKADETIDCGNRIISPGFIDVQINGGFGYDFSQINTSDITTAVSKVAKGILSHGVTSFCPTIITSSKEVYHKVLPLVKKCEGSPEGAGVLGIHVEGPFISREKKGAHPEQLIRDYENGGFEEVLDTYGTLDNVTLVTLAPEKKKSNDVIEELTKRGITVSVGHSMANLAQGEEAVCCGARFITHLFNAMLPFHHRDPHLVGLLTSDQLPRNRKIFYGIISDGVHTHPAALRIAHRVNPDGLVLVTDAIQALGYPPGTYAFGEQTICIDGNRAVLKGTDTLSGSIASMDTCVQHFLKMTDCGQVLALQCATLHPAQMLGIHDTKGTLDFGSDADFVMLDDDLHVLSTHIAGELVFAKDQ